MATQPVPPPTMARGKEHSHGWAKIARPWLVLRGAQKGPSVAGLGSGLVLGLGLRLGSGLVLGLGLGLGSGLGLGLWLGLGLELGLGLGSVLCSHPLPLLSCGSSHTPHGAPRAPPAIHLMVRPMQLHGPAYNCGGGHGLTPLLGGNGSLMMRWCTSRLQPAPYFTMPCSHPPRNLPNCKPNPGPAHGTGPRQGGCGAA